MARRLRLAALVVVLGTLGAGPVRAADPLQDTIRENTNKLAELRARIREKQEAMDALADQAAAVARSREEIEQEIEQSRTLTAEMAKREADLAVQSATLAGVVDSSRTRYADQKRALAATLRAMYIRDKKTELEMALTADSFSELMTRMKVARMLARLEAGVVEHTRREGQRVVQEQRLLDAALAEIWQTREEKRSESERLELLMAEQAASLRELETERKDLKNSLLELNMNEQKLNYILADLEQQRTETAARMPDTDTGAGSLAAQAGRLDWPVQGELVRGFGRSVHPQFKTVTLNNGWNIAAGAGAPVAAVAGGKVEFSDDLPGFGPCVILDHGEGYYTLYAHLGQVFVAKGDAIARGQVLAEVGRPSGAEEPQLYFELRQGRTG